MRSDLGLVSAPEQRALDAVIDIERQQQIVLDGLALEHRRLLEFAADAEFGDAGLVEPGQVGDAVEQHVPSSGLVLPVMMSIIVVLPAPFGPMMARISPGSSVSDRLLMA